MPELKFGVYPGQDNPHAGATAVVDRNGKIGVFVTFQVEDPTALPGILDEASALGKPAAQRVAEQCEALPEQQAADQSAERKAAAEALLAGSRRREQELRAQAETVDLGQPDAAQKLLSLEAEADAERRLGARQGKVFEAASRRHEQDQAAYLAAAETVSRTVYAEHDRDLRARREAALRELAQACAGPLQTFLALEAALSLPLHG
jgi:hypothetical protein